MAKTDRETTTVNVKREDAERIHRQNEMDESLADTVSRLLDERDDLLDEIARLREDEGTDNPDESTDE